jgi:transposase-like protein
MEKKIAPSEHKAQALRAVLQGHLDGQSGEELLSTIVRLSTERILQEALEHEQAQALGRGRYEARGEKLGYRNGDEKGRLKTAEGIFQVQLPQIRGQEEPLRSAFWGQMASTSDVLKRLIVEMDVGGLSQRDSEYSLASALGHFVRGKSTVSELSATLK